MALETGTYISDLVATNPPGTDLKSQGDDHIRLIKSTVKATFPNITGAVTPTHTELNYVDGVVEAIQTQLNRKSEQNLIINGDFSVAQRGTSFASVAGNTYTIDRWLYSKTGAMIHTVSQTTDVPTVAEALRKIPNSITIDCTTVDASIAAGDFTVLSQKIEGNNFINIAQRAFLLGFWVKATKTGIYCVSFRNSGLDRSYVAEYTVNATDTWEYKTVSVSASPSAGTWDYATGTGLHVDFTLASGTNFHTTAGAWQTGNFLATANQVNACDNVINNFLLTGVKLIQGSYDADVEIETFSSTLEKCLRYFWKTFPYATTPAQNAGVTGAVKIAVQNASAGAYLNIDFTELMRTGVAITTYNPSAANANWRNTTTATDVTRFIDPIETDRGFGISYGAGPAVNNVLAIHASADAEL